MCYSVSQLYLKAYKNAKHKGKSPEELDILYRKYLERLFMEEEIKTPNYRYYYSGGFDHQSMTVIANSEAVVEDMNWGLIPHWIKSESDANKIQNKTLNARSESIFEKPSFRESIKKRRCLLVVPSYFEYHNNGKEKVPYKVFRKDKHPLILASIWDEWKNQKTGEISKTFSIVTTKANPMLSEIHNTGKEPRMPLILDKELAPNWLKNLNDEFKEEDLETLMRTFPEEDLDAYQVRQLIGKKGVGNTPEAIERFEEGPPLIDLFS